MCWRGVQCHTKLLPEHWGCQEPDPELCRRAEHQGHAASPKQWVQTQHLTTRGPSSYPLCCGNSQQSAPEATPGKHTVRDAQSSCCPVLYSQGRRAALAGLFLRPCSHPCCRAGCGRSHAGIGCALLTGCSGAALSHGGLKADHHCRRGYPSCAQERPNPTAQLLWNCPWPPCAFPWLLAISLGGDGERQG